MGNSLTDLIRICSGHTSFRYIGLNPKVIATDARGRSHGSQEGALSADSGSLREAVTQVKKELELCLAKMQSGRKSAVFFAIVNHGMYHFSFQWREACVPTRKR
jgi:hypothetical protein